MFDDIKADVLEWKKGIINPTLQKQAISIV